MTTYNIPGGIDSTGATDVTAAILSWISGTVLDGSIGSPNTVMFGLNKTYRMDGTVLIQGRNYLNFDGNGSTFQTDLPGAASHRYHFGFKDCTNLDIDDITIRGPNTLGGLADGAYVAALEFEHAFPLLGCTDVRLHHCQATQIYGDFVLFTLGTGNVMTEDVVVDNNYFANNGRQGFAFVGCNNIEVRDNTTGEVRRSLMDFEPNGLTSGSTNIWVHDNSFGQQRLSFIASKGAPGLCGDITIEDNDCYNLVTTIAPTGFGLRSNWKINRNTAAHIHGSPQGHTMDIRKTDTVEVNDNVQSMQPGRNMVLVEFSDCTDFLCEGNSLANSVGQYRLNDTFDPAPDDDPVSALPSTPAVVIGTSTAAVVGTINVTIPTGSQTGDEILIWVGHHGTSWLDLVPAGWTVQSDSQMTAGANQRFIKLLQRTLTAADITAGTFQFTFHEADRSAAIAVTMRGATNVIPEFVLTNNDIDGNDATNTLPGATTTSRGCLVMFFFAQATGNGNLTVDAGLDDIVTVKNSSANGFALGFGSTVYTGAGQGANRVTTSSVNGDDCGVTLAYKGTVLEVLRQRVHMVNALLGVAGGVKIPLSAASKIALG